MLYLHYLWKCRLIKYILINVVEIHISKSLFPSKDKKQWEINIERRAIFVEHRDSTKKKHFTNIMHSKL